MNTAQDEERTDVEEERTEPMDGMEIIQRLRLCGQLLPDLETLQAYLDACYRDRTVAPLFTPSEYMRGSERLEALTRLTEKALVYRRAYDDMEKVAAVEADPERDAAAAHLLRLFNKHHGI